MILAEIKHHGHMVIKNGQRCLEKRVKYCIITLICDSLVAMLSIGTLQGLGMPSLIALLALGLKINLLFSLLTLKLWSFDI